MKILYFFLCLLLFGCNVGDTNISESIDLVEDVPSHSVMESLPHSTSSDKIFKIVESMPRFAGCEEIEDKDQKKKCSDTKIISFINKHIRYPPLAREKGIDGTIVIRFIIEKDGSISFDENKEDVILRGGDILGEEALRVIKLMPKWTPGKQNGKLVRVEFTMPIKIHLAE